MTDVEVRVTAILEKIVDISVMEIGKIVGVSDSGQPEESACSARPAQKASSEMVGKKCFLLIDINGVLTFPLALRVQLSIEIEELASCS